MDVSSFDGSRQWDHVRFTQPGPSFKAEIYAYRANHGQFNTSWGRDDAGRPLGWLLNLKPLMPAEEQRRISKTYISAFLEATLKDHREYIPIFEDWRVARAWIPDTLYFNRYQDASYIPLASFDEDADLTTTTALGGHIEGENLSVWNEGKIPWRDGDRGYNGVFLGWNRAKDAPPATYTITLPVGAAAHWHLSSGSTIELSVAPLDEDVDLPGKKKDDDKDKKKTEEKKKEDDKSKKKERESPDFTIELVTTDGVVVSAPASRFMPIPPPFKEKLAKLDALSDAAYNQDWEAVFQSVRAPLSDFQLSDNSKRFDPAKLSIVRLRFDRTPMYKICISAIGFGKQ